MTRASPFRLAAEGRIRAVLRRAALHGMTAKDQRRELLSAYRTLVSQERGRLRRPHAVWLVAIRAVTGHGVMALVDAVHPSQETMDFVVPRRRREVARAS